ncbi:hypothetical protein H696_05560 [Fonticula alba]|uniref:Uncharacterized protein n=1 Tax=Fonticula alba TaxID=691883 RepID=A0A058Z1L4_FONAL|nr:hypothetical protein H696_05560 [Fonticula alba]KCV67828.1 hypothetical protein H696_05560 [Fonticula alba]|eukprot:XP_009497648.1 hypothetical protein H696_05560 [Fonticula alba]
MRVLAAPKSFSFPAGSADTTPLAAGDVASTIAHLHGLGAAFNFPASAAGALPAVSLFDRPNLSITAVLNAARPVVVDALASQVPAEAAFELPRDTVLNSLFTAPASSKSVFAAARDAAIDGHTFVLTSSPGSLMSSVPVASSVHGLLLDSAAARAATAPGARRGAVGFVQDSRMELDPVHILIFAVAFIFIVFVLHIGSKLFR